MEVLFFCPTREKATSKQLLGILQTIVTGANQPIVDVLDEHIELGFTDNKKYDAAVIVYTPEVELSECLFEIMRYIDREKPPGRFIFLPKSEGKAIIPPIFHPIRALQLQLFYYSKVDNLEAQLPAFEHAWGKFVNPDVDSLPGKKGGPVRQSGFGLILFVSILILFLAGLIAEIFPFAQRAVLDLTATSIRPPAVTAFWLQESFQTIDTATVWQVEHYYTGQQALQTTFSDAGLRLSAAPVVTEAVYQLDSLQSWPLDDLQSLSFSFALSALDDPAANNAMLVSLVLSEDNAYHLDCAVFTERTDWKIQCQIQSPTQAEAVSAAVPLSLDTKHTATLVFNPLAYSVQFFLDDQYYGLREIKLVPYWRGRNFKLQIKDELQDLSSGSFSSELESLDLAHQP